MRALLERTGALLALAVLLVAWLAPPAAGASLAMRRAARLRRGINTSHWFAQSPNYSPEHLAGHTTARDIDTIRRLGFDHIRLSVEPSPMFDEKSPGSLPAAYLAHLDRAVRMITSRGLAVIVDIHPTSDFKKRLASEQQFVESFASFWRALAGRYARTSPELVFFEILNEPEFEDPYRWSGVQARLARAIREAAPRHTIIATGAAWSAVDRLLLLEPLADRNVIYTFHFYEPHAFTHQGATWGSDVWPRVKGLTYPSSPESVAGVVASLEQSDAQARDVVRHYGEERWNPARVDSEIARAARWARSRGVPVYCGEFGVYRAFTPRASRLAWVRDVRRSLERHGIGWAMWDYAGGFAVVTKRDGAIEPDRELAAALGLTRRSSRRARAY